MNGRWVALLLACFCAVGGASPKTYQGFIYTDETGQVTQVIRNQAQLDKFRKRIPSELPSMKRPAPPNNDPLLSDTFDFSREMLVVAGRGDNLSARPRLLKIKDGDHLETVWSLPEKPPEAKPYGWGTYSAVVVPASNKEVRFSWKAEE